MGLLALHVDDESNAARVMLELRIVKPLFHRRAGRRLPNLFGGLHYVILMTRHQPAFTYFSLKFHSHAINVFKNHLVVAIII
jgi:hypothetical protein